ncbi:MAG TPA: hypothetical protein VNV65_08345 [Candidatus Solibacter sp.]|nr:hypothetical protein [Candidatus Solibacter sp.]
MARIYLHHLARDPRRERLFLASLAFLVTFGLIRGLVYSIRYNVGPFHNVSVGGTHVHHLVWGILLLLVTGYASLVEFGTRRSASNALSRLTAVGFGVGAALTLDEFALWLNLQDVYWERQGRQSVDAVLIFGALMLVGVFGKDLFRALAHELRALLRGASYLESTALDELERIEPGTSGDPAAGPAASGDGSAASGDGGEGTEEPVHRAP